MAKKMIDLTVVFTVEVDSDVNPSTLFLEVFTQDVRIGRMEGKSHPVSIPHKIVHYETTDVSDESQYTG